ncbi:hypothetical protein NE865_08325 [Phthorimaea operculella]|nr:hypothetical protein NE865_08325 [Phthorimaea operculella]
MNGRIIIGQEAVNEFAKHFSSVSQNNIPKLDPAEAINSARPVADRIFIESLGEKHLLKAVKRLKAKTATGPDGIPPFLLKDCITVLQQPLLHLYNKSLETARYPDHWKCSRVTPVPKVKSNAEVTNHRPIAVLAVFDYELLGHTLLQVDEHRDLGVILDARLNFHSHVIDVCKSANRMLGFTLRTSYQLRDPRIALVLYKSFVMSRLEYDAIVWDPQETKYAEMVEKVQRKFARSLYKKKFGYYPYLYPSVFVSGMVGLDTLKLRRKLSLLAHYYFTLNNKINNQNVTERVGLSVPPTYKRGGGAAEPRYRRPLLAGPSTHTVRGRYAPTVRAVALLNSLLLNQHNADLFGSSHVEFKNIAIDYLNQFNRGRYQIIVASDEKALEKPDGGLIGDDEQIGRKRKRKVDASVDQFNRGRYQIIVASDEKALEKPDGGLIGDDEQIGRKRKRKIIVASDEKALEKPDGGLIGDDEQIGRKRKRQVDQFNRGRYQIIVASDEKALEKPDGGLIGDDEQIGRKRKRKFNRGRYQIIVASDEKALEKPDGGLIGDDEQIGRKRKRKFNRGRYQIIVTSDEKALEKPDGGLIGDDEQIGRKRKRKFNRGRYQIIVASDEKALEKPDGGLIGDDEQIGRKRKRKQTSKRKKDKESGVSRGIDFQHVSNVINFDFPLDITSYVHRAGRTARGNNQGTVLSFVSIREKPLLDAVEEHLSKSFKDQKVIQKYEFALEEVEGFRYRSRDAWRAVTRIAVREARLKEIKQELLNCNKLQGYFEENPNDLAALRRDKALHTVKYQARAADPLKSFDLKNLKKPATADA